MSTVNRITFKQLYDVVLHSPDKHARPDSLVMRCSPDTYYEVIRLLRDAAEVAEQPLFANDKDELMFMGIGITSDQSINEGAIILSKREE